MEEYVFYTGIEAGEGKFGAINLLAPEFGNLILAHSVCKMRIIPEPKQVALLNKRYFEEKKRKVCSMLKKYIKWGVWRVAVCPSYI
jgi:hypothetical protein